MKRPFLKVLWDRLDEVECTLRAAMPDSATGAALPTAQLLDTIIENASGLEPWREALVKNAAAVEYCCTIQRDWNYANQIYLLSTTQRKGWHAELFTFVLQEELREAGIRQPLAPLSIGDYEYSRWADEPPCLPIHFPWKGVEHHVKIYGRDGNFDIWIDVSQLPDLVAVFSQGAFTPSAEHPGWLLRTVSLTEIEPALRQLAAILTAP